MYLEVKVIIRRPSFTNKMACDEKSIYHRHGAFFMAAKTGESRNAFRCKEID